MLKDVCRVDRFHGIRSKRETIPHVEPDVDPVERIAIHIDKGRKILRSAAEVEMLRSVGGLHRSETAAHKVVGRGCFGDGPKGKVLVALVKQNRFSQSSSSDYSRHSVAPKLL